MLDIMAEGLDKFRQPDNGYSWSPNGSSITSQGARVSLGTAEGDVNGTTLAMLLRRDAYLLAGHSPRVLWYWDRAEYWDKLLNASPIVKNDLSKGLSFNFDNMTLNGKPNEWKLTTEVGSVNVQKDPKNSSNQALKISTKSSGVTFATLPFSSVNNISKLKFTGRFMVENSNNGAFFYNKIGAALQWCFVGNGDSFNLTHRQSEVGVGSVILALDYGKWYDIKIEYEPKGLTNTKVRFYINNSLKLESNRYMGINNNKGPVKNIDNISFNSFIAGTGNVYLDDVSIIVTK
jgi:hypothetical protein